MVTTEPDPQARTERVSIRVTVAGKQAIQAKAQEYGVQESDIARWALAHGLQHMPAPTVVRGRVTM